MFRKQPTELSRQLFSSVAKPAYHCLRSSIQNLANLCVGKLLIFGEDEREPGVGALRPPVRPLHGVDGRPPAFGRVSRGRPSPLCRSRHRATLVAQAGIAQREGSIPADERATRQRAIDQEPQRLSRIRCGDADTCIPWRTISASSCKLECPQERYRAAAWFVPRGSDRRTPGCRRE